MNSVPRLVIGMLLCVPAAAGPALYLGLSPPSGEPQPFEPPLLVNHPIGTVIAITFAPDFRQVALSAIDAHPSGKVAAAIYESRQEGDGWSRPRPVRALYVAGYAAGEAAYSPDGRWLFFSSDRPPGAAARPRTFRSAVQDEEFAAAETVALDLPPDAATYYPRLLASGDLSFTSRGPGRDDLYIARARGAGFDQPELLPGDFNSPRDDWDLVESRDGRLRIWVSARAGGVGRTDLFYSRRDPAGRWSAARNLAAVNTAALESAPALSPDDQVLFFLRRIDGRERMFWVRLASVLEEP